MGTATFVKQVNGTGEGRVYRLDPPIQQKNWDGNVEATHEHVWVSAAVLPMGLGCETFIFPSDADGNVVDWGELPGSYKGGLDHAEALRGAGYEVSA